MDKILSSVWVLARGTYVRTHTYIHAYITHRRTERHTAFQKTIYLYSRVLKKCKSVKILRSIATITKFSMLSYLCNRIIIIKMLLIQRTANHPNHGNYSEPSKHHASSDNGQCSTWYVEFLSVSIYSTPYCSVPPCVFRLLLYLSPSLFPLGQILFPTNHAITFMFSTLFSVHVKDGLASRKMTESMYLSAVNAHC